MAGLFPVFDERFSDDKARRDIAGSSAVPLLQGSRVGHAYHDDPPCPAVRFTLHQLRPRVAAIQPVSGATASFRGV